MPHQASCLCKTVNISVENTSDNIGACHCNMCRKWSGGPYLSFEAKGKVSFKGEDNISEYKSSDWAVRGFCKQCGTHLYYKLQQQNQYIIPAGLFEQLEGKSFDHQIFIDEKPDYYHFANQTENMTGAEVFAKFAPES